MDFNLTEEQQMLQDSVGRFVEQNYGIESLRQLRDGDDTLDRERWTQFAELGLVDVVRRLAGPDTAVYSWGSQRAGSRQRDVGWRLDYYLVSNKLAPEVSDVVIHDQVMGSDHCPVSLYIE